MPTNKRQQICDAFKTRMQTILTASGYETNIGQKVKEWRTSAFDGVTPSLSFADKSQETEQRVGNVHHHRLLIEVTAVAGDGENTDTLLRKILADITKAVGTDRKFSGLVFNTDPVKDEMSIEKQDKTIGAVKVTFALHYRTENFNPYQ
jgi:hypothetical protein